MKKILLMLVFVLGTGTLMNAKTGVEKLDISIVIEENFSEDVGCASDCVRSSREQISNACAVLGENPNDHLDDYKKLYKDCYNTNCGGQEQ